MVAIQIIIGKILTVSNPSINRWAIQQKGEPMSTEPQEQLERICKVSRIVRTGCKIMFGLTILVSLVTMALIIIGSEKCSIYILQGYDIPMARLTTGFKIQTIILLVLTDMVVLKGLYHLHRLFANYAIGNIFTTDSVAQIRQLGTTFLLGAGLQFLSYPIAIALVSHCAPAKEPVTLEFPFFALIAGGLLILLSWVMDAGKGLREENELTV